MCSNNPGLVTTDSFKDLEEDYSYEADDVRPRHPSGVIAEIVESTHTTTSDSKESNLEKSNSSGNKEVPLSIISVLVNLKKHFYLSRT